jgi:dynein heavy chain
VPLPLVGKVEHYLELGIQAMMSSVRKILKESVKSYEVAKPRHEWLVDIPSQCMLVASQVWFTKQAEDAFEALHRGEKDAMRKHGQRQVDQLTNLIKMVQGELSRELRQKVMVLITMDTHARDVVSNLVAEGIDSAKRCEIFPCLSSLCVSGCL